MLAIWLSIRPFLSHKFNYEERREKKLSHIRTTHNSSLSLVDFKLMTAHFYDNCTSCKCTALEFGWLICDEKASLTSDSLPMQFEIQNCHNHSNIQPWVEYQAILIAMSVTRMENCCRTQWKPDLIIEAAQRWRHQLKHVSNFFSNIFQFFKRILDI